MAEMQVDATGDVVANRPSEVTEPSNSVAELVRNAPEPSENASAVYQVLYPTDQFVMEGMPVVTTAGTPLTDEQAEKLLPVAEASGVKIVKVD